MKEKDLIEDRFCKVMVSSLYDSEVRSLLDRYSVKPTKEKGQSFLTSQDVIRRILKSAELQSEDKVLEIGGGLGALSKPITKHVQHLYVIELDKRLFQALGDQLGEFSNVTLIHGDALKVKLPRVNKIIANLPYSAASEITFRLLHEWQFDFGWC